MPMAYLCGQEDHCMRVGSARALSQAKTNVEEHYAVVGVLEELSKSEN